MATPLSRYELSLNSVFALSLYCTKDTCLGRNMTNVREEMSKKQTSARIFIYSVPDLSCFCCCHVYDYS